jgi:hypothetical protein
MRARHFSTLFAVLVLSGCGALSTHQPAHLMEAGTRAWTGGIAWGPRPNCRDTTDMGNGCVLVPDPYIGWRTAGAVDPEDSADGKVGELGVKFSGIPFTGGTLVVDLRLQNMTEPIYMTYDFGLRAFPCVSNQRQGEDESSCHDNPFGGGAYVGFTVGNEWAFAGGKFDVDGNSWDGLQLLPGIFAGLAIGPRGFKVIPSFDAYFYQWPLHPQVLDPRWLAGIGLQSTF